jgi:DNA-binding CsgD family transcriptional regulator/type II secretory pathway predicted ATPase ExeA
MPETRWPLAGRSEELSRLTAALVARRGAVITGPAGAGKTTLAMMCLQLVRDREMSVARTTATLASRRLPFGTLAPILPPDLGIDRLSRDGHGQLLRFYARAVTTRAQGRPLVVFVDDAHLLDDGSATLMHHLALTRAATVLVTVQSGAPAPDSVVAMWKDGLAERIELGALGDAAIEELLVTVLGGPVDAASVRQLADRSRGNPLYLRELVTGAMQTGALAEQGCIWRLRTGGLRPTARLAELVALRLGDLSDAERDVLELLALGEPLGQAWLDKLADPSAVAALERKGLIASRMDSRRVEVWLTHPVYGDVVRAEITALRERALARSLAEVVEATGGRRREDSLLLASLRLSGGGGSAELLTAGAVAARARHDHFLAERLARAALAEGGGFEARFIAAEAAHFQGRPGQAERELASLAATAASDEERARVALIRHDNAFFLQGREADSRLIDDEAGAITDPYWRDELLSRRLLVMGTSRGPQAPMEAGAALLRRPGSAARTAVHVMVSYGLVRLGRLDEAIKLLNPILESTATPAADEPWDKWALYGVAIYALICAGRLGEAEATLSRAWVLVADRPATEARSYVGHWLAAVHLEQGRVGSAFRRATESYTLAQQLGRAVRSRWPASIAAQALALAGQAGRAAETLAALDALDLPANLLNETDLIQARAWATAAAGDLPGARDQLEAAACLGEQIGDLIGATSALHGLARLGRARHVAARLAALADHVDGDLVAARAAYATAIADRDSEALDKVSGNFELLGAHLYAAEASADAAIFLRRAGRARYAAAVEQKAGRLLARCEGAITPAVQAITARVFLTPGELDAARQAAAGRSSRQIAADMQLSVRTVESRLQRVYEKLGVGGRHELGDALADLPAA